MPKLLIAGYGFLGVALKACFEKNAWSVEALNLHGGQEVLSCDLTSRASVASLKGEYDFIIHCAATRGGGVEAYRSIYGDGVSHLRARFPETPLIFTSSTSVYGQNDHERVTEKSEASPSAETSKVLREVEEVVVSHGGAVLRLSALCGAGRCHTVRSFLNGSARLDAEDGGRRILNFVHREDVAEACYLLAKNGEVARGEIFNVSAISLSQRDCFQELATHYKMPLPPPAFQAEDASPRTRGRTSKVVDSQKIRQLGWSPKFRTLPSLMA